MFPGWLHALAIASLIIAAASSLIILIDIRRHPQKMAVMNWVWPLTGLFGSVIWLWLYWHYGRVSGEGVEGDAEDQSFAAKVAKGASHCGAGCTMGDIIAEWACFALPVIAVWFGYRTIFAEEIFAVWVLDFILAFGIGIVFQYFAIAPMRDLSLGKGIWAAIKADTISISSWQVGMYGMMAILQFAWFRTAFGDTAPVDTPEFWWAMQIAMLAGFATAFPVNWWLIRKGVKEEM